MKNFIISLAILTTVMLSPLSQAGAASHDRERRDVAYGVFHSVNEEQHWIVIDDQAMFYGSDLRILDQAGTTVSSVARIEPGTPVKFEPEFRNQAWHVRRIRLLDELPVIVDEEGVPE